MLVIAAVTGGVFFYLNYEVQTQYENGRLVCWKIVPKAPGGSARHRSARSSRRPAAVRPSALPLRPRPVDDAKLANRRVSDVLVRLLPRFELIAVQGVRGKNQGVLVRLVEQINAATGRNYDFATCPTQQRDALEHYSAFCSIARRIEVDRTTVHFVEDRLGRIRIKPLVGSFRVAGRTPPRRSPSR